MSVDGLQEESGADGSTLRTFDDEDVIDLIRGVEALVGSPAVGDLAYAITTVPRRSFANAFNRKQVASKRWLVDCLAATIDRDFGRVLVVGGWHGLLSSLLLDDARLSIAHVTSLDVDPTCEASARAVNRRHGRTGRFEAVTANMYGFAYSEEGAPRFDLVVNTSCEHIPDLRRWLDRLPAGTTVVLQSNDYRREPDHMACVDSMAAFEALAALSTALFLGELPAANYRRFMLIGRT